MEIIYIIFGASAAIILFALLLDYAVEIHQKHYAVRATRKLREEIHHAAHIKDIFVEKHRPHGNHRRITVS
jgi:hypothetical protein